MQNKSASGSSAGRERGEAALERGVLKNGDVSEKLALRQAGLKKKTGG